MVFNSITFLYFFPIVVLLFYVLPKKSRMYFLLLASYFFYMCWNYKYLVLIIFSTVSTFYAARWMERTGQKKKVLWLGMLVNLAILFFFKYWNFGIETINTLLRWGKAEQQISTLDILLPVGISFYTFQALGYLIDVYRGDIVAEKNLFQYALFVSFFPQLVAGPIERTSKLLPQIRRVDEIRFEYDRVISGLMVMLYGLFLKIVIADWLAIMVDCMYDNRAQVGSLGLLLGAIGFSFQIYCDFYGYSTIAVGAAQVLGISLSDNFLMPYFATSIKDFWRRWHISLSTWFRDYVYIPLGGNRCSKRRKNINLLITFLVSGLWHGAGWHYVVWGGVHGVYQVIEGLFPRRKKATGMYRMVCMIRTFLLATLAWIFFRAATLSEAIDYIWRILTGGRGEISWLTVINQAGVSTPRMLIVFGMMMVLLFFDILRERREIRVEQWMMQIPLVCKWMVLLAMIFSIMVLGAYGLDIQNTTFLYFQF